MQIEIPFGLIVYCIYCIGSNISDDTVLTLSYGQTVDGKALYQGVGYKTASGSVSSAYNFTSGVEFTHKTADGRESVSTITIDGNTLTQVQSIDQGKLNTKVVRVFDGDKMVSTLTAEGIDIVATATFERD